MFRKSQSTLLAACAATSLLSAAPAFAINDDGRGGMYESLMDMVGLSEKEEPPPIAYRERSPLVVPPKSDLPPPQQPASKRTAAWPTDQEVVRAKKKAEANAKRRNVDTDGREVVNAEELRKIRSQTSTAGPDRDCAMDPFDKSSCTPEEYWRRLSIVPNKKEDSVLQAGVEPEREFLTQPPKGYMKATQNVKATFEPKKIEEDDPRAYFREQAARKSE